MHSCDNTATKGWSWPNFWANLVSFSRLVVAPGGALIYLNATLCISLVIIYRKYARSCTNDCNAHAHTW
jgi:hypothetical protein